jgi:hypothetical protein
MSDHNDTLFRLYAISAEINTLIKKLLDEEYLLHDKEKWMCKLCNKSTYETEYDYLAARDMHLECALKEEFKEKEKQRKLDYVCGPEAPYKKMENTNDNYRLDN